MWSTHHAHIHIPRSDVFTYLQNCIWLQHSFHMKMHTDTTQRTFFGWGLKRTVRGTTIPSTRRRERGDGRNKQRSGDRARWKNSVQRATKREIAATWMKNVSTITSERQLSPLFGWLHSATFRGFRARPTINFRSVLAGGLTVTLHLLEYDAA
jgi:hypothetical protein